jgi:hypothetical protein
LPNAFEPGDIPRRKHNRCSHGREPSADGLANASRGSCDDSNLSFEVRSFVGHDQILLDARLRHFRHTSGVFKYVADSEVNVLARRCISMSHYQKCNNDYLSLMAEGFYNAATSH